MITGIADTSGLVVGQTVTGTGIGASAKIGSIRDANSIVLTVVSTATGSISNLGFGSLNYAALGSGATTTSGSGNLQLGNGGATGSLSLSSAITNNGSFTVNRNNAVAQGTDFTASAITGSGSFTQAGSGTTTLNAANLFSGGTTVTTGTLLLNNVSGSGTGTGAVAVNGTGILGGTGRIAPTGSNGISVASGGFIAPGASIGTLTVDLSGTTGIVNLASGAGFKFELGAAGTLIAPGSSELLVINGAAASKVAFGGNDINLLGTATAEGYYKLFDTSFNATTWTGLTLGGAVTGGHLITSGLTASNYGGVYSGKLILADGSVSGTSAGDIYLQVVPEPETWALLAFSLTTVMIFRRRRQG